MIQYNLIKQSCTVIPYVARVSLLETFPSDTSFLLFKNRNTETGLHSKHYQPEPTQASEVISQWFITAQSRLKQNLAGHCVGT